MSDEARAWLRYAEENLQSAQLLLQSALFNPALQHAQRGLTALDGKRPRSDILDGPTPDKVPFWQRKRREAV